MQTKLTRSPAHLVTRSPSKAPVAFSIVLFFTLALFATFVVLILRDCRNAIAEAQAEFLTADFRTSVQP